MKICTADKESFRAVAKLFPTGSQDLAGSLELLDLRAVLLTTEPRLAIVLMAEGRHADVSGNRIVGELRF